MPSREEVLDVPVLPAGGQPAPGSSPAGAGDEGGGGGGFLSSMPLWGWAVVAGAGIALVWYLFLRPRQSGGSAISAGAPGSARDATGATLQSLYQAIAREREAREKDIASIREETRSGLESLATQIANRFSSLTDQMNSAFDALAGRIEQGEQRTAELGSQLARTQSEFTNRLGELGSALQQVVTATQGLTGQVRSLTGRVTTLEEATSSLPSLISRLQNQIATISTSVGNLANQIATPGARPQGAAPASASGSPAPNVASPATKTYIDDRGRTIRYDPSTGVAVRNGVAIASGETPTNQSGRYGRDAGSGQVVDIPTGTQVGTKEWSEKTGLIPNSPAWWEAIRAAGLIK